MDEGQSVHRKARKSSGSSRGLIIVLILLCVMIIGLAIGIILVNVNNHTPESTEGPVAGIDTSEMTEAEIAELKDNLAYIDEYGVTVEKAKTLLAQNPADVNAVMDLYSKKIEEHFAKGEYNRAQLYMEAEISDLISAGYKQEALNVLGTIDMSHFVEADQYRLYNKALDLAKELGDADLVAKFEILTANAKAAFEAAYQAAELEAANTQEEK